MTAVAPHPGCKILELDATVVVVFRMFIVLVKGREEIELAVQVNHLLLIIMFFKAPRLRSPNESISPNRMTALQTARSPRSTPSNSSWSRHSVQILAIAFVALSFTMWSLLMQHQQNDLFVTTETAITTNSAAKNAAGSARPPLVATRHQGLSTCGILPFDLSVNHLQRIELAGGALPEQRAAAEEDFLPIIAGGTRPELRFRLKPAVGASPSAIKDISAYTRLLQKMLTIRLYYGILEKCPSMACRIPFHGVDVT